MSAPETPPCGCRASNYFPPWDGKGQPPGMGSTVVFCPLHKAAQEMLEALKFCQAYISEYVCSTDPGDPGHAILDDAVRAIAKAKGES